METGPIQKGLLQKSRRALGDRRLGGESNREIVSFRFVRSCVRARGVDVRWMQSGNRPVAAFRFPFSHNGFSLFPCEMLFPL